MFRKWITSPIPTVTKSKKSLIRVNPQHPLKSAPFSPRPSPRALQLQTESFLREFENTRRLTSGVVPKFNNRPTSSVVARR